ncbi:hypothetical protein QE152_g39696 [Popillia japonica]|uniref:Uncharacterized protein n=1 Tax=Popillia japonica TaxID=7064 RepID=A0AAW1HTN0_POPJA
MSTKPATRLQRSTQGEIKDQKSQTETKSDLKRQMNNSYVSLKYEEKNADGSVNIKTCELPEIVRDLRNKLAEAESKIVTGAETNGTLSNKIEFLENKLRVSNITITKLNDMEHYQIKLNF